MREAYLTGGNEPRPEPKPATLTEALAGIERAKESIAKANEIHERARVLERQASKIRKEAQQYDVKSDNYPYKIMEALGYAPGQVRREIATGKDWVVTNCVVGGCRLQGITSRQTCGKELGRFINPLKWRDYEDTGRRILPMYSDRFGGVRVPRAAPDEKPLPFPEMPA